MSPHDFAPQKYFAGRIALLAIFATLSTVSFAAENEAFTAAVKSIELDTLKKHVEVLADDTFEGREAGSRGGRAAALYLTKELDKHKLTPLGDDKTYFQNFDGSNRNILGLLEGSDPSLKNEYITVESHLDGAVGTLRANFSAAATSPRVRKAPRMSWKES